MILIDQNPNTVRSFDHIYHILKFHGIFLTSNYRWSQTILSFTNFIVVNILYPSTFVIQLCFLDNVQQLLDNIPMNVSLIACSTKFYFLQRMRLQLIEINSILRELDDSQPISNTQKIKMEKTILHCRKGTLLVAVFYCVANTSAAMTAAFSGGTKLAYEMWIPYDWSQSTFKHQATVWIQLLLHLHLGLQEVANDLIGPFYILVLNSHLEIIMERFACLHYDSIKKETESYNDFVQCIESHRKIMKIFNIIQSNLSCMMLSQFVASILVISTSAVKYLIFSIKSNEVFSIGLLMFGGMAEMFPSCYYSDKFMNTTDQFIFSIYSSNWTHLSPKFRKQMVIFMQMTQQKKMILAGKLIPMTLATFLSMMKTAYSVVTVMKRFG